MQVMTSGKELGGRVAIVTGAARNIGRAIALDLAAAGAAVVVNARAGGAEAEAVAREIEAAGGCALAFVADVTDEKAVGRMAAAAVESFGRIDILVNNAAVRREQPLEEMTLGAWREILGVILDGAFICAKACLPQLAASGAGAIVNIGGLTAHLGAGRRAHVVTAKAGLVGLTRALAHDLAADNVTVNCVSPGRIATARRGPEPNAHRVSSLTGATRHARRHRRDRAVPVRPARPLHHGTDPPRQRRGVFGFVTACRAQ
jgi:3-oxoacyl-[acyl-carrier protein] reductase